MADIMALDINAVPVRDDAVYEMAGVFSFARGLFVREALVGSETSYKRLHQLQEGQLVLSRLKGWEGALALVGPNFSGLHLSTEFPTFRPHRDQALPEFVWLLMQRPNFWETLKGLSSGMGGRKERVKAEGLLSVVVPVPQLPVQRRIVDLIDHIDVAISMAQEAANNAASLYGELLRTAFAEGESKPLGDVAEFINGYPFKPVELDGKGLPVIRIKQLLNPEEVPDRSSAKVPASRHLQDGDLVFTWSGTLAVRTWDRGPALLNQHLFRVIEAEGVRRQWLRFALDASIEALNGQTHGSTMKHITKKKLLVHPVNVPDVRTQGEVADLLESVLRTSECAKQSADALASVRSNLLTSLLSGDHEIPESYDKFLEERGAA